MEHLLSNLHPGLLEPHIEPLRTRIRMLLDSGDHSAEEVTRRIRILHMAARPVETEHFQAIASTLLARKRLVIHHYNRGTDETLRREVLPQRLVYFRDNWYLDGWCHLRKGLRSFVVDAISQVEHVTKRVRNVADRMLDAELGPGYGIFAGRRIPKASLCFTPERARWVSREEWHPAQQSHFDDQGRFLLMVLCSNDTELIMDSNYSPPSRGIQAQSSLPPQL